MIHEQPQEVVKKGSRKLYRVGNNQNNLNMTNPFIKKITESVRHWYIPLIVGMILIGTAIWTFSYPAESYLVLTTVFSLSFLFSGILEIFFAVANRKELDNWGWTLTLGIMTALVGVMLLTNPEISMISLPLYVGFVLMFRSFVAMGIAIDLKNYGVLEWGTLMVIGVLGLIFSLILIRNPIFAGMTLVFWTGTALLLSGVFNIYVAMKLKNLHKSWNNAFKESE